MNPMLQNLNRNNPTNQIMQIKKMLSGKDPNILYQQMMQNNPDFASFVNANRGKSPQQIAIENGLNPDILNNF